MNVMVVDDQKEVVDAIISGVKWEDIGIKKVFAANSVKDAKIIFQKEEIGIILCDIEMPPTNGFELIKWVKKIKPATGSIFLSSHAEFEYAQEAVKLGSFDYILQPAPYREIEKAIRDAVLKMRKTKEINDYYKYREVIEVGNEQENKRSVVERSKDYIRSNISEDLSRSQVAEHVYVNPEYLSRLFKKETGFSVNDYIIFEKLKVAKALLKDTHIPVSIVASKIGYSNFSYFSQVFKKHTGISPVEYRNEKK